MRNNRKRKENELLAQLTLRAAVARNAIATIQESMDDPRAPDALAHYQGQLAEIEQRIAEEKAKLEGPKDVVIGLQPAQLFARKG